jgi:hypothetical protein
VQLFNTVTEFQTQQHKDALVAQKEQKAKTAAIIQAVGTDKAHQTLTTSNDRIIQQIQSKQAKWKVLEDESEDEEGNIKIEDF